MFDDLVVSVPRRHSELRRFLLPAVLLHLLALAALLAIPERRAEMAELVPAVMRWRVPAEAPPEPRPVPARPVRATTRAASAPSRSHPEPAAPAPAPGPPLSVIEPSGLDIANDAPAPCLRNCDGVGAGSGDGPNAPSTGQGVGPGVSEGPVRVGIEVAPPRRLRYVEPIFPAIGRTAGVSGVVALECVIDVHGQVTELRVLRGHPLFTPAAVEAVRQWTYTPSRLNDRPVPVIMTVTVRFLARR
jgi:protein TonB